MNIFNVLNRGDSRLYEPSMSAMLGYLLDNREDHGLGSIFARRFLKEVSNERFSNFFNNPLIDYRVSLEEQYESENRKYIIDVQINIFDRTSDKCIHQVIIENKIRKGAANEEQLKSYYDVVIKNSDINEENTTFIFLTPKCQSSKLENEYNNLDIEEPKKNWIYWDDDTKSITSILEQILKEEALGEIDPINEYVRHTLKAFRKYCLDTFSPSITRKLQSGDIGTLLEEAIINVGNKEYTVVRRDSGQIQVFDDEDNLMVAKRVLEQYINEHPETGISANCASLYNTREIGRRFFKWYNEQKSINE